MKGENLNQTLALIRKDLLLDKEDLPVTINSLEDLKRELQRVVSYLLDNDFGKLINALYRIDVSEAKVKSVIAVEKPEELSEVITELILNRELQKIETRAKYRS